MDTAYIWLVLGIIIALVMLGVQFYSKRALTLKRIIGTTL